MALYKFFLIGTNEAPVVEVEVDTLRELGESAIRNRFIEGRMVEIDGQARACAVLIPTARIQLVVEHDQ
jgi:hypothetical protein